MYHYTENLGCAKAARAAHWLRLALDLVMVLGVMALAYLWIAGVSPRHIGAVGVYIDPPPALVSHPHMGQIGVSASLLVWMYGLWRLQRLMRCFEAGDFFGLVPIRHVRAFALTLLLAVLLDLLLPPLLQLGATLFGLAHLHGVRIQLDGGDVGLMLVASLFYLIAWILAEARQAVEDSAQII